MPYFPVHSHCKWTHLDSTLSFSWICNDLLHIKSKAVVVLCSLMQSSKDRSVISDCRSMSHILKISMQFSLLDELSSRFNDCFDSITPKDFKVRNFQRSSLCIFQMEDFKNMIVVIYIYIYKLRSFQWFVIRLKINGGSETRKTKTSSRACWWLSDQV